MLPGLRGDLGRAGTGRGDRPGAVRAGVHAKAALAVCAHYLPVARAAKLVAALTGVNVSAGFVAGIRGKAARLLAPFMDRVGSCCPPPGCCTPTRPRPGCRETAHVHVACTEFLTAMHTGDRTKEAIDAGGVLPGYAGTIVRDGYKGYEHLTDALHAWCGAHGLRDLAGLYRFDPGGQVGPGPWPTCSSTPTPRPPPPAPPARPASTTPASRHPLLVPRRRRQGLH